MGRFPASESSGGALRAGTGKWQWAPSLEGPIAAPRSHRVLFAGAVARVLEVEIGPGEREPQHTHRHPSVMIVDEPARIRYYAQGTLVNESGTPSEPLDSSGRHVSWMEPEGPHEVENIDSHRYHAFRVEFLRTDSGS
jgi:hypothetical protein